jgi:enterochelin esterase-like enzyme
MRHFLPGLVAALLGLVAACSPAAPAAPPAAPVPTLAKPALLLTPRPTLPPTSTPVRVPTTRATSVTSVATPRPTASPTPSVRGTPVKVSEPLQGTLVDDRLNSPIIGQSFAYRVYLPPDYQHSPQRRYPVLYMLHGAGGNYTEWTDSFLPEAADRLMVANEIQPMIIVMPDDGEATYYANWSDNGPRWGDYISEDVVSTIDQRYRTLPRAVSRAIGGLSMGALGALNLAFQHPDVFGVVGAHSPSVRLEPDPALWFLVGQNFWDNNPVWQIEHRSGLESLDIWIDAGADDIWLPNIEAVHDALVDQGLHAMWHVFPGEHEAEYWIEHVPDYLHFYGAALRS